MNFDEQRDERMRKTRQFTIGGETFGYRAGVEPEMTAAWFELDPETKESDAIKIADDTIIAFLEKGEVDRWRALRQPGALENGITSGDLLALVRWLISEQGARPTEPSRSSTNGSPTLESVPALTEESSSTAARG